MIVNIKKLDVMLLITDLVSKYQRAGRRREGVCVGGGHLTYQSTHMETFWFKSKFDSTESVSHEHF